MLRHIIIWLIICLNHSNCFAQLFPFVTYTPRDGLISSRVRFISQDSKGRMYFATYSGLCVYDGSHFINYTTNNGLITSLVNDIVEVGDDSLWIIPNGYRLHCMVHGKIHDIPTANNYFPCINNLFKCKKDGCFYGMADEGLFRFEKNQFNKIDLPHFHSYEAKNLFHATESDGYLFIISDVKTPVYPTPDLFFAYNISSRKVIWSESLPRIIFSILTPQNDVLVSTSNGIFKIDKAALNAGKIELLPPPGIYNIPAETSADYMYFDRRENLWLTTSTGIMKVEKNGTFQLFSTLNGLPVNNYSYIFQDHQNTMWFASERTGITKMTNQDIRFYPAFSPGLNITDISTNPGSDSVWFYDVYKNSLAVLYNNQLVKFTSTSGNVYDNRIIFSQGKAYISDELNFYQIQFLPDNRFRKSIIYSDSSQQVYNSLADDEGNIIATGNNLLVFLRNHKTIKQPLDYYAGQAILTSTHNLWIISRLNKLYLYRIHPDLPAKYLELLHIYGKQLPDMDPRSITCDHDGNVWIGTRNHGLFCFSFQNDSLRLKVNLTLKDGMSENFIQFLYCDPANNIWACSPEGLDKIIIRNGRFCIDNVTKSCGMFLNVTKVQSDKEGTIWGLTNHGILKIHNTRDSQSEYQPKILFTKINAGETELSDNERNVKLTYTKNDFLFQVASPSFLNDHEARFSFKLNGKDEGSWSFPSASSEINYVNLPPGKYSLNAKCSFLSGRYPDSETVYKFTILPPWWQTWWFRDLEILFSAALIFYIARLYSHNKLQKQHIAMEKRQAIEKERTRIATDMHDDLGAGLSRIKYLSEAIKMKNQEGKLSEDDLNKIALYSIDMIDKMGEIVWALNEKNDNLNHLLGYTRSYAMEYLISHGIECEFLVSENIPSDFLSGEIRRNIFLSVKEILHNVVKHSSANKVRINFEYGNELRITIQDNGIGIGATDKQVTGNGLNNIRKRMSDIGGKASFYNSNGTTVEMIINLRL